MKKYLRSSKKMLSFLITLFGVIHFAMAQQQITVEGIVSDATTKELLPGVTVVEKGTQNATMTDADGKFRLMVGSNARLVFTHLGYEDMEVAAREHLTIQMASKAGWLDEVVVVGYGTINKRDVTGSVSKVSGEALTALPVPSFEQALQGRAAGVSVISSSGMAGASSSIKVRGVGSITAGGDPLYVIDGVIIPQNSGERVGAMNTNPLNTINPEDIESVEILKDASATAIYGSRGTNGVILITTKRGKFVKGRQKPIFDIGYRSTFSTAANKLDLLNTEEYVKLYLEGFENDRRYGVSNGVNVTPDNPNVPMLPGGFDPRVIAANGYKSTDWQDQMTQTGFGSHIDGSMTYGSEKLASYIGVSYHNDESFLKENSFNLFSARANIDYSFTKRLKGGITASYANSINNIVPVAWDGGLGKAMSTAMPYYPIYNDDGSYFVFPSGSSGSYNPVAEIEHRFQRERFNRTTSNAYLKYDFTDNLSLTADGGIDYYNRQFDAFTSRAITSNSRSTANQSEYTPLTLMGKAILDYHFQVGENQKFKVMLGSEILDNRVLTNESRNVTYKAGYEGDPFYKNSTIDPEEITDPNDYTQTQSATGRVYGFVSAFGRINYSLKDRYLVTLILRQDGSSRFGENNRFGYFPAASLGWIMSEEDFMKGSSIVNYLKLKVGYGKTGNAEIPNTAQFGILNNTSSIRYDGDSIRFIQQLPNPDLRWETTNSFDAGIEFGLLKDRINGEISAYYKRSNDLFLRASVPTSSGFRDVLINVGELWNKGIELSLNTTNIKNQNFTWTTTLNISYNQNKVLNTGGAGPDAFASAGDVRVLVGYPVGVNYLVKELRVDPENGLPVYEGIEKDEQGNIIRRFETYEYSTDYRQPLGKPWPDYIGGFINNFQYKNWDLSIVFNFVIGGNIYDDAAKFSLNSLGSWNLNKEVLNRWQNPGDETDIPRMTLNSEISNRNTSRYLYDASYLRLKSVSLGYNIPVGDIKGINKMRVALIATNLLTFTKYPGLDPEIFRDMENQQERNLSAGVTYLTPPQARTFSVQFNVGF